jgi:hypothetical protein
MSRFYADISGGRGTATRQGHAASGIRGHIRGWNSGVKVIGRADDTADVFDIWETGGSSAPSNVKLIGSVRLDETGTPKFYPAPHSGIVLAP